MVRFSHMESFQFEEASEFHKKILKPKPDFCRRRRMRRVPPRSLAIECDDVLGVGSTG